MHPDLAAGLLERLDRPDGRVLDPFCGGGTVLVEALVRGMRGWGFDVNPVAVRLSRLRCALWPETRLAALERTGREVSERAHDRARPRAGLPRGVDATEWDERWFQPQVRHEIAVLIDEIGQIDDGRIRDALELVLSSLLVKASNLVSETDPTLRPRQLPRGVVAEWFGKRTGELAAGLRALRRAAPPQARSPRIALEDARRFRRIERGTLDAVVTSPPYPGVYDYAAAQRLRLAVMGWNADLARRCEIGRRGLLRRDPREALDRWRADMDSVLARCALRLRRGGWFVAVVGDVRARGAADAFPAGRLIAELAGAHGLRLVARATRHLVAPPAPAPATVREHVVWLELRGDRTTRTSKR